MDGREFQRLILATGDWDTPSRTYTFHGAIPDGTGGLARLREVMLVPDKDHFTYGYYEGREGSDALAIRLDYARLK